MWAFVALNLKVIHLRIRKCLPKIIGLVDYCKIKVKAGDGGSGCISLDTVTREIYSRADGGDGGNGGHVYLQVGNINMWEPFKKKKKNY